MTIQKRFGFSIIACFLFLLTANKLSAQETESNKPVLDQLAKTYTELAEKSRKRAFELAKKYDWITFKQFDNGTIMSLQSVDAYGLPQYLITENNATAANTTRANRLYNGGGLGLNLSGSSPLLTDKIGIWDGGSVYTSHQEFAGGRILNKNATAATDRHATHVAGTMMATGVESVAKGMAFGLQRLISYDFGNDDSEMATEATSGMLLSNHSYGFLAGWHFNSAPSGGGAPRWEWYGREGDKEDYKFGFYGVDAEEWDKITFEAPYYLPVKSAGNSRNASGPAVGEKYFRFTSQRWTEFTRQIEDLNSQREYDLISLNGNAKNILTVGAVFGIKNGPINAESIRISDFSSWGPTDDGRIKPDIVGMGVQVTSTVTTSPVSYAALNGTSMSTPNVSGSLVLLQEAYMQKNNNIRMRSATLKGLAIHTADDVGRPGPDYIFGWGVLNAEKAAQLILEDGTKSRIYEDILGTVNNVTTSNKTYQVTSSGNGPIVATICWTDPPGIPPFTESNNQKTYTYPLNERTPRLVNDLDLRINDQSTEYTPWILSPDAPDANATRGDNIRDNVEQVIINDPIPGKTYTINVRHKNNLDGGKQAYSLIISGIGGAAYCTPAISGTQNARIESFKLSNIDYSNANCRAYTDNTAQLINLEAGATYPLSIKLGACNTNANKIAKIYIDFNQDGSFNETNELIATTSVINGSAEFKKDISIPSNVTLNAFSLLRVVLSETADVNSITSCGTYNKGEVMDYRVAFLRPSRDVGISAILNPVDGNCAANGQRITVTLNNYGSTTISNVPVKVIIKNNNNVLTTITESYTGSLAALNEVDFTLNTPFNSQAGQTYELIASTELGNDTDAANNQKIVNFSISNPPTLSNTSVVSCGSSGVYNFSSSGAGTVFWYKNANDQVPVTFTSNNSPANYTESNTNISTFHAGINDFRASVGPKTNMAFSGGGFLNGNNPAVLMNTKVPVILESARLYIGSPGKITFTAENVLTGLPVSSVTLDVVQNTDGQVYDLNLLLPTAGNYRISISYEGGSSIYRNNAGVTGYPFSIGGIFSITGNTATDASNPEHFKNFYYYFYDLVVKSAECAAPQRTAVTTTPLSLPTISMNGNTLTSSSATGNQWLFNGEAIPGATGNTHTSTQAGSYSVRVSSGACIQNSATVVVGVNFPLAANNFSVSVTDATCTNIINGRINITAAQNLRYLLKLTRPDNTSTDFVFNNTLDINNLTSGNYKISIYVDGKEEFKTEYSLVVGPKSLTAFSRVDPVTNSVTIRLDGGNTYQIKLNDELYFTSSSEITLDLKNGTNKLVVSTDQACQGTYEEEFLVDIKAFVYPNPFQDILNIKLEDPQTKSVLVSVLNSAGLVVYKNLHAVQNRTVQVDLSSLEAGFYFLNLGTKTYKILKK